MPKCRICCEARVEIPDSACYDCREAARRPAAAENPTTEAQPVGADSVRPPDDRQPVGDRTPPPWTIAAVSLLLVLYAAYAAVTGR